MKADYRGGRVPRCPAPGLLWVAVLLAAMPDECDLMVDEAIHQLALVSMDSDLGGSFLPTEDPMHVTLTRSLP